MEKEHKTRWGCIIIPMIILLLLGIGIYTVFMYVLPSLQQNNDYQSSKTTPKLNPEIEQMFEDAKTYGNPVKESDPSGKTDPFAP